MGAIGAGRVPALPGVVKKPLIHAFRRLRQEDQEFRADLGLPKANLSQANNKLLKW